jgi:hypothetical protein
MAAARRAMPAPLLRVRAPCALASGEMPIVHDVAKVGSNVNNVKLAIAEFAISPRPTGDACRPVGSDDHAGDHAG